MIAGLLVAQLAAATPPGPAEEEDGGAVVRGRRGASSPVSTRVTPQEARRYAGTQGDVLRVVESMPGVGRTSFGAGPLVLWGAAPGTSRIYVDGVPIPRLFHGAGLRSTVNGFFVDDVELVPGGYGAEFGRASGALVRIDTAALRPGGWHGAAQADLLDTSVVVSRSVGARTRAAVGLRYGYLADLVGAVTDRDTSELISLPRYGDYQARFEYRASPGTELTLFAFGSVDRLAREPPSGDPARARSLTQDADFHRLTARYVTQVDGARVVVSPWAGFDARARRERVGAHPTDEAGGAWLGGLRASWSRPLRAGVTLRLGVDAEGAVTEVERVGSLTRPPRDGDLYVYGQVPPGDARADRWTVRTANAAPWAEAVCALFRNRLAVTAGVRLDVGLMEASRALPPLGDTPPRGLARVLWSVEPRLAVVLRVTSRLALKAAGGRYQTPPSAYDLSSVFGNAALTGSSAWHAVGGVLWDVTAALSAEVVGFYRDETGVPVRPATAPAAGEALVNAGAATAYGAQVTVRHRPAGRFSAWLTYTLARSEVRDPLAPAGRLSDHDQTHLLTGVGSLDLGRGWTVGVRARLASGLPRTPVVGRTLDALTGDYQPVFGAPGSERLPLFFGLDARIDKTFRAGGMEVTVFADVLNALNRPAAEEVWYDPTYRERRYITGLPILADLGVRGEW